MEIQLMLAKTPRKEDFSVLLKIQSKPSNIVEADAAWRKAVAAREAGQARHIEAAAQLKSQVPGQPPRITQYETDELGAALGPLFNAEREASDARAALRAEYEAATSAALTAGLAKLHDALSDKINELEELLTHGAALHAAAVAAGVKLPSHLPVKCREMLSAVIAPARLNMRTRS